MWIVIWNWVNSRFFDHLIKFYLVFFFSSLFYSFCFYSSDDGRTIPAGVDIRLYLGMLMRNPKYYTNPDTFDPERFASSEVNQFTFIPFSAGKRDCIGKKFAMFSMKTVLSRVLQCYELIEMGEEPIIQNELVLKSVNGFQMALKHRVAV